MKRLLCAVVLALAFTGCSESPESVGIRLQRECESIIDAADALSSPIRFNNHQIIDVLAKDPKVKKELGEWSRRTRASTLTDGSMISLGTFTAAAIAGISLWVMHFYSLNNDFIDWGRGIRAAEKRSI